MQNNGHYAVQGHSRSPKLVLMEVCMQLPMCTQWSRKKCTKFNASSFCICLQ